MAFSGCKIINEARNSEENGFMDLEGISVQEMADCIMTPADGKNTAQNPKNISNVFGNIQAWMLNAHSENKNICSVNERHMKVMYILWASAKYKGYEVEIRPHTFDGKNPIENKCMSDLKKLDGWKEVPECVVELLIHGKEVGIFAPEWKCFVPGTGFRKELVYGQSPSDYLEKNPHVKERYHIMIDRMVANGADNKVIGKLLDELGGPVPEEKRKIYEGEMMEPVSEEVAHYMNRTAPGSNPDIVCGHLGTNTVQKLLDRPVLINTGLNAVTGPDMKRIGTTMVAVLPVQNTMKVENPKYHFGNLNEEGMPEWIEFTGILDGILYHQIYTMGTEGWKTCRPQNYVDMSYMVPEEILTKYNYLVQDSEAASLGLNEVETCWKIYPEDSKANIAKLTSKQYTGEWEILQRTKKITRMELCDKEGNILGTVFPETTPALKRKNNTVYVSFDPAGAVSVRLVSIAGSGHSQGITYNDMIHPVTPMAKGELQQAIERRLIPLKESGTHFDSLLQIFSPEGPGGWSRLMVESRIWQPDQKALFEALKAYPGTMSAAMAGIGVVSNPKEMIARSNLKPAEKEACMWALKQYIGAMILEAILALAREGYAVQEGNLEFLISYPENGSGEGVTKMMKAAIKGALEFVNEFLTPENRLVLGTNVSLSSESEATAEWHKNNPPEGAFLGTMVAAGTPDYGYSTHDYSLRANGHLYMFSLPYAAQNITNATLAKVYDGNALALTRCFSGGSQELMKSAMEAMQEAMNSKHGKLYERLGFILSLNRLFKNCNFCVTGANVDAFQIKVQQIVEAKLNVAIPAYADSVVRALKNDDLKRNSNIILAPVGNGSLAIHNTAPDFEQRFIERLRAQIQYQLEEECGDEKIFEGNIQLLPNNDTDKISVAQGLIDLKEAGTTDKEAKLVKNTEPTEYYLDVVYGTGENADQEAKEQFHAALLEADKPATKAKYNMMREELYNLAFEKMIDDYTYDQFEESFNRWGYTGTEDGIFDNEIRTRAKEQFDNLIAELKQNKKALIMSCPHLEKEFLCGAMIDVILER